MYIGRQKSGDAAEIRRLAARRRRKPGLRGLPQIPVYSALRAVPLRHPFASSGEQYHEVQFPNAFFPDGNRDGSGSIIARCRPGRPDVSVPSGHRQPLFRSSQRTRPNFGLPLQPFLETRCCLQIGGGGRGQAKPEQPAVARLGQEPDGIGHSARRTGSVLRGHRRALLRRGRRVPGRTGLPICAFQEHQYRLLGWGRCGSEIAKQSGPGRGRVAWQCSGVCQFQGSGAGSWATSYLPQAAGQVGVPCPGNSRRRRPGPIFASAAAQHRRLSGAIARGRPHRRKSLRENHLAAAVLRRDCTRISSTSPFASISAPEPMLRAICARNFATRVLVVF